MEKINNSFLPRTWRGGALILLIVIIVLALWYPVFLLINEHSDKHYNDKNISKIFFQNYDKEIRDGRFGHNIEIYLMPTNGMLEIIIDNAGNAKKLSDYLLS